MAGGRDAFDHAGDRRRQQAFLGNPLGGDQAEYGAALQLLSSLDKRRERNFGRRDRGFERPEEAVENMAQQSWPQPSRQRPANSRHGISRP